MNPYNFNSKVCHYCAGIIYRISDQGIVEVVALEYDAGARKTIRLPGGTQVGVENALETLDRELREELAASPRAATVFYRQRPIYVQSRPSDPGRGFLEHRKLFFLVHRFLGTLRTERIVESDGVVLGIPKWYYAFDLLGILHDQGHSTRAHALALEVAMRELKSHPLVATVKSEGNEKEPAA